MSSGSTDAPPAPFTHQRSLDGIRALAVLAVMLFHSNITWARAGFLGVDVFLVLSGFLITFLLLREIGTTGHVAVKAFWLRRARRLLPAATLMLVVVALFGAFVATDDEALGLRGDLLGSLFYVQNWRFILSGHSYFSQFGSPSPLRHMWSLAIEEQWYLIWPLLFLGIVRVARSRMHWIGAIILGLAAGSAGLMFMFYERSPDNATRAYYGTDTRAHALLIGAALAVAFSVRRAPRTRTMTALVQVAGAVGLASLAWIVVNKSDAWTTLYRGGFLMVAVASAAVIAAAMTPGPVRAILSCPPLPTIGLISYGLYLWHWPIFVLLSPDRTGIDGRPLMALRFALTFAVATVSYCILERPIREQRFGWVRGRALWIPITAGVTTIAILGLTAAGAAAKPRPDPIAEFIRIYRNPQVPGATRVLIVGDSIAFTLANIGMSPQLQDLVWVRGVARIGCGLLHGVPQSDGVEGADQDRCADWPKRWAAAVSELKPEVAVLLLGGWEIFDRTIDGRQLKVGTPEMEAYLHEQLDRARKVLTADGATLALLTTPCFSTERRDLGQWGETERAEPSRVQWLNEVWTRFALDHPADVVLLDLFGQACPGGQYAETIDGAKMRFDGVHFAPAGAALMWKWLAPQLRQIARGR